MGVTLTSWRERRWRLTSTPPSPAACWPRRRHRRSARPAPRCRRRAPPAPGTPTRCSCGRGRSPRRCRPARFRLPAARRHPPRRTSPPCRPGPTEITTLTSFESTFGIRQVTWYTFPSAYYGFAGSPGSVNTDVTPLPATYTPAGASVFSYANSGQPLPISKAFTYLAQPATDGASTPLLTDAAGDALALVHTYPTQGNRQNLALTFDSNENLTHNLVLGYGLVNWVNGGLYLGERHSYLQPQPDDILLASGDSTWPAGTACATSVDDPLLPTFRMTGTDLQKAVDWQKTVQANPVSAQVALEWPFNGNGTTGTPPDALTQAVTALQGNFKWISHTWDHENLDAIAHDPAVLELTQNNTAATTLGLTTFNTSRLITPDAVSYTHLTLPTKRIV